MILFYNLLILLILILSIPIFPFLIIFNKNFRRDFTERFSLKGFPKKQSGKKRVLVHCASVGEFNAAYPLIERLMGIKNTEVIVSCQTPTGKDAALKKVPGKVRIFPIDFYLFQKRFLKIINPDLLILVETEIWPSFIAAANNQGIRIISVNSVLSNKKLKSYMKIKGFFTKTLNKISKFFIASKEDLERFRKFDIPNEKLMLAGNIKMDGMKFTEVRKEIILEKYFKNISEKKHFIITLGSSRNGEEEIFMNGIKKLLYDNDIIVIIAPRHLNRLVKLENYFEIDNYEYFYISSKPELKGESVYILDSMGCLKDMYAISDICFVGGTLVPVGGHNLLEPVSYGKPVVFGKYTEKVYATAEALKNAKIGFQVEDGDELKGVVENLMENNEAIKNIKEISKQFIEDNKGVIDKIVLEIQNKYL
ncbi:hypothetical protein KAU33_07160 [Candidatus Dependentiae bacterium]|nr:hypothetical protein [Candidatus Dependentiae bacterium]